MEKKKKDRFNPLVMRAAAIGMGSTETRMRLCKVMSETSADSCPGFDPITISHTSYYGVVTIYKVKLLTTLTSY
jgi:hypothetical protein